MKIKINEVRKLQKAAGLISEMDTSADAEREDYENQLIDDIVAKVKELQTSLEGASVDYVLYLIKKSYDPR
jgi:hypothetical protein